MSIRTRETQAHRTATRATISDVAEFLSENLGRVLTAHLADVDPKTVDRWLRGDQPRLGHEQRLRLAYQVFQLLLEDDSPHTVRAWFIGLNPQLDDRSPVDALRDGQTREVLVASRAFISGG